MSWEALGRWFNLQHPHFLICKRRTGEDLFDLLGWFLGLNELIYVKSLYQRIAHKDLQLLLKGFNQESNVIRFVLLESTLSTA